MVPVVRSSILVLALLALPSPAAALDKGPEVRAVAGLFPPFVMAERGRLTGFSIDLWEAVAARMDVPTSFRVAPDTASAFEALRDGKADVVVTGHFYTPERNREFDFSYSILNAGQQVMVRSGGRTGMNTPLRTYMALLFSWTMLLWLGTAFLLLLIPAHVVWFMDRRGDEVSGAPEPYFPGIFRALAWTAQGLLNQSPAMPRQKLASLVTVLWLFAGVVFVSLLVAQLTASITVEQFRGLVNGPDDLAGKVVATQAGIHLGQSTPADWGAGRDLRGTRRGPRRPARRQGRRRRAGGAGAPLLRGARRGGPREGRGAPVQQARPRLHGSHRQPAPPED